MPELIKIKDQNVHYPAVQRISDFQVPLDLENSKFVKTLPGFDNQYSLAMYTRSYIKHPQKNPTESNDNNNAKKADTWHLLDGFSSVATLQGYTFAFGDGCGGHEFEDVDQMISNAVKTILETAIDELLKHDSAQSIDENITAIFYDHFTKTVFEKLKTSIERANTATTVIAGRTFKSDKEGFFELIGFSVGDSMLMAYHPLSKKFTNIAPGIKGKGGTANYPINFDQNDIRVFRLTLEEGTIIIPVSDGIGDYLPQIIEEQKELKREYRWLDESKMKKMLASLPKEASVHACIKKIMEEAFKKYEQTKQEKLKSIEKFDAKAAKIQEDIKHLETEKPTETLEYVKKTLLKELTTVDQQRILAMGDDCLIAGMKLPTIKEYQRFVLALFRAAVLKQDQHSLKGFAQLFKLNELEQMLIKVSLTIDKTLLSAAQTTLYQTLATQTNPEIVMREVIMTKKEIEENSKFVSNNNSVIDKSFLNEKNGNPSLRKVKIYSEDQDTCRYTFFLKPQQLSKFEEKEKHYQRELSTFCKK